MPKAKAKTNRTNEEEDGDEMTVLPLVKKRILAFQGSPPKLNISEGAALFRMWRKLWSAFMISSGIDDKDDDVRDLAIIAAFNQALSPDTIMWLEGKEIDEYTPDTVIPLVEEFFEQEETTLTKVMDLMTIQKKSGEGEQEFADRLRRQTNEAGVRRINNWTEFLMMILFLQNVRDPETRKQILMKDPDNLQDALKLAKAREQAEKTSAKFDNEASVSEYKRAKRGRSPSPEESSKKRNQCGYCGNVHGAFQCPAHRAICGKCQRKGHYSHVCKSFQAKPQSNVIENTFACGSSLSVKPLKRVQITANNMRGQSTQAQALPDTGANINIIPEDCLDELNIRDAVTLPDALGDPRAADGRRMRSLGLVDLEIKHKKRSAKAKFVVMNTPQWILGLEMLIMLGLISENFPEEQREEGDRRQGPSHRRHERREPRTRGDRQADPSEMRCFCCGKTGHKKQQCQRKNNKCNQCQKRGHCKETCFRRRPNHHQYHREARPSNRQYHREVAGIRCDELDYIEPARFNYSKRGDWSEERDDSSVKSRDEIEEELWSLQVADEDRKEIWSLQAAGEDREEEDEPRFGYDEDFPPM